MDTSENKFLSLLFEEGLVLENLKFFPGDGCSSPAELSDAAHEMLSRALAGEGAGILPSTSRQPMAIGELAVG